MAQKFTQRHYIAIADCIIEATRLIDEAQRNGQTTAGERHGVSIMRLALEDTFKRDSARFDHDKFQGYIAKRVRA